MSKILELLGKVLNPVAGAVGGLLGPTNGLGFVGALAAGLFWLVTNREETVCLSYLDIAGIATLGFVALDINRRAKSPNEG